MQDELSEHLNALQRDDCYRVDSVMKETPYERTEKVYFVGANGSEQGPFVRKKIAADSGLGEAYGRLYGAQKAGRRFAYLPRIVECYSVGGDRVVVMEYVYGETLQETVYRCDPSIALASDLFPRLCNAVEELHSAFDPPLIHRDLKPSNVMVTRDSLTIIDFGIARSYKEGGACDTRHFGTRAYAPPEQYGFGQTDERSDVYALGMLLYFCLTESTPDAKARTRGFRAASVPEAFRRVIAKAAELDPADRYQSVGELKASFGEALDVAAASGKQAQAPAFASRHSFARAENASDGRMKRGALSRVPAGVGYAWNILLLATLLLFLAVSVNLAFNPDPASADAQASLAKRILTYGSVMVLFFVPAAYLISDRRFLKRHVPFFRKMTIPKDIAIFLMLFGFEVVIAAMIRLMP